MKLGITTPVLFPIYPHWPMINSLFFLQLLFLLIIFSITLLSGLYPFYAAQREAEHYHPSFDWAESVATGIFLGAGFLHLLPDAAHDFFKAGYHYPFAYMIAMISFFTLLLLEHVANTLEKNQAKFISQLALLTALMLSIHSFLEGAAIGISNELTTSFFIFLAIIAHKGAASFALAYQLQQGSLAKWLRYVAFLFFAFMTPAGIVIGHFFMQSMSGHTSAVATMNALAAGTFFYIGSLHGLERAPLIRHCCNIREFFFMLAGFALMALLAFWV